MTPAERDWKRSQLESLFRQVKRWWHTPLGSDEEQQALEQAVEHFLNVEVELAGLNIGLDE